MIVNHSSKQNHPFVEKGAGEMPDSPYLKKLKIGEPADYRIEIQGYLDQSWSGRLGGMLITAGSRPETTTLTELTGRVADQAQLIGVLNSLYELHLPILSVELMPKPVQGEGVSSNAPNGTARGK
jgi:hypothetical protein